MPARRRSAKHYALETSALEKSRRLTMCSPLHVILCATALLFGTHSPPAANRSSLLARGTARMSFGSAIGVPILAALAPRTFAQDGRMLFCWVLYWTVLFIASSLWMANSVLVRIFFPPRMRRTHWSCIGRRRLRQAVWILRPLSNSRSHGSGPAHRSRARQTQLIARRFNVYPAGTSSHRNDDVSHPCLAGGAPGSIADGASTSGPGFRRDFDTSVALARTWLQHCIETDSPATVALARRCLSRIDNLPPDEPLDCFSRQVSLDTTLCLEFLGSNWLRDEHINAGLELIEQRLSVAYQALFLSTFHLISLRGYRKRARGPYNPSRPRFRDTSVLSGKWQCIVIPAHINGNHWSLFLVDLRERSVCYSDSAQVGARLPEAAQSLLSDIRWWLAGLLPGQEFQLKDCTAPRQADGSSCGVILLSSVATELLNYPVWTQETWKDHRMNWFLWITSMWLDDHVMHVEPFDSHDESADLTAGCVDEGNGDLLGEHLSGLQDDDDWDLHDANEPLAPWLAASRQSAELPSPPSESSNTAQESGPVNCTEEYSPSEGDDDVSDTSDDGYETDEQKVLHAGTKRKRPATSKSTSDRPSKIAHSETRHWRPNEQSHDTKVARFQDSIRVLDPHAAFDSANFRRVKCSRCNGWRVCHPYKVQHFKEHLNTCRANPKHKGRNANIATMFKRLSTQAPGTLIPSVSPPAYPCMGLTTAHVAGIADYLTRTGVAGGGAPPRPLLAKRMFAGRTWTELSSSEQHRVRISEAHQYRWINRHGVQAVFSRECKGTVSPERASSPCSACVAVSKLKIFKNAVAVPIPNDHNRKFVPYTYREKELGELYLRYHGLSDLVKRNINSTEKMLRDFAHGVLNGLYQSQEVLLGAVQATITTKRREAKGKSMTNMKYPTAFDNFGVALASISPAAYRLYKSHFGGRGERSMQMGRAKVRMTPGISEDNVRAAVKIVESYSYQGPLVLACDDTKVEPVLREIRTATGAWLVIGQASEPIHVRSQAELDNILEDSELTLADKLRLWALIIPVPKVPPIIIAGLARGSSDDAAVLFDMHQRLATMLHNAGLIPVAYASDGTEVERKLQRLITENATIKQLLISNSREAFSFKISIPLVHDRPLIIIQDSKHGAKTARNQLFSGARLMALGSSPMYYTLIRDLATHPGSPLFWRDVDDPDRQEDRAAARIFSAETLHHHCSHYPQRTGVALYLFFLGELFDAWQSRSLPHSTRVRMVLRCRFFLHAWRAHIDAHPDHTRHRTFISRESMDIFTTLCDSLIALIVTYRDWYPTFPLLPWLHSTEPVEHIFGVLRQLKYDFNFADFLFFVPKLCTFILGHFSAVSGQGRGNQTAAGYWHTYANDDDIDPASLQSWPTDSEISTLSDIALSDVQSILRVVGIDAEDMLGCATMADAAPKRTKHTHKPVPPRRESRPRNCPSLLRLPRELRDAFLENEEIDSLSELMRRRDELGITDKATKEQLDVTAAAYVAADLGETEAIISLPDTDDAARLKAAETISDFVHYSRMVRGQSEILVNEPPPPPRALFNGNTTFNFDILLQERRNHQNQFTSDAIRRAIQPTPPAPTVDTFATSLKSQLASRFTDLLGKTVARSGYGRKLRYASTAVQAVAEAKKQQPAAEKHGQLRSEAFKAQFKDANKIHPQFMAANVTPITPLRLSGHNYVLVLMPGKQQDRRIAFGEVLALYTLKSHRHAAVEAVDSIGAISYASVQVYGAYKPGIMTSLTCTETLGTSTFVHLPPQDILFSFTSYDFVRSEIQDDDGAIEVRVKLGTEANKIYRDTVAKRTKIIEVNTTMRKRRAAKQTQSLADSENDLSSDT